MHDKQQRDTKGRPLSLQYLPACTTIIIIIIIIAPKGQRKPTLLLAREPLGPARLSYIYMVFTP
jgi:hypothetical protein